MTFDNHFINRNRWKGLNQNVITLYKHYRQKSKSNSKASLNLSLSPKLKSKNRHKVLQHWSILLFKRPKKTQSVQ